MDINKKEELIKKYLGNNTPKWIFNNCVALIDEIESMNLKHVNNKITDKSLTIKDK